MKFGIAVLIIIVLITPAAADFMYRGNIERTGVATDTVNPPLELKWIVNLGFQTESSPVVANNVIYIGSFYGLHALDAATGVQKWVFKTNVAF